MCRVSFSDVALDHALVDSCAMQLVTDPKRFDVLLTENMFGDILSDDGVLCPHSSIGMLPLGLVRRWPSRYTNGFRPTDRPRHRGPGQGESRGSDRFSRDDATLQLRPGGGSDSH